MATDDFFRSRLDAMIDRQHPLAVLTTHMPWRDIEAALAPVFEHKDRSGKVVDGADLFGPTAELVGVGVSARGRRRLPIRLMVALLYLKHAFNLSDEELVERWSENVYWQFFSGMDYFEPRLPCDATQIGRFRRLLGEAGVEQLLKTTIETAVSMKVIKKIDFERVIVDTTVQEKAIAHPVDSRLLEKSAPQGCQCRQAIGHGAEADVCQGRQAASPQGRRLRRARTHNRPEDGLRLARGWASGPARPARPRQAVQTAAPHRQAPTHDPGRAHARCAARAESNFAGRFLRACSRPGAHRMGHHRAEHVA